MIFCIADRTFSTGQGSKRVTIQITWEHCYSKDALNHTVWCLQADLNLVFQRGSSYNSTESVCSRLSFFVTRNKAFFYERSLLFEDMGTDSTTQIDGVYYFGRIVWTRRDCGRGPHSSPLEMPAAIRKLPRAYQRNYHRRRGWVAYEKKSYFTFRVPMASLKLLEREALM